jgi:hypothetical protein
MAKSSCVEKSEKNEKKKRRKSHQYHDWTRDHHAQIQFA